MRSVVRRGTAASLAGVVLVVLHFFLPANIAWDVVSVVGGGATYALVHSVLLPEDGTGDNPQMP